MLKMGSARQEAHVARLRADTTCSGDASLQNGLSLALSSLQHVPPYGHREVNYQDFSWKSCGCADITVNCIVVRQ